MSLDLPGLGEGVEFHRDAARPRLIDRKNGRTLELTEIEAELVALYSGERDPRQLAAKATSLGVEADASLVATLLTRLAQAGFIAPPEVASYLPMREGPLRMSDRLPAFRSELSLRPSASSRSLVEVADPTRNRSFTIYDFEASVARMLDGRRTAEEVIDSASSLGIPMTLASLESFLRQMGAYGFLSAPVADAAATEPPAMPDARQTWSPEVRALYQGALRLFRAGKNDEALGYLEALFVTDPEHPEARALQQRISQAPSDELNFRRLHEPLIVPVPAPVPTPLVPVEAAQVPVPEHAPPTPVSGDPPPAVPAGPGAPAPTVAAPAPLSAEAPPGDLLPGAAESAPAPTASAAPRPKRRPPPEPEVPPLPLPIWKQTRVQLLAVVGVVGVAALWPVPCQVTLNCQLDPVTVAKVVAPREGTIRTHLVEAGEVTRKEAPLARYQTADLEHQLTAAADRASSLQVEMAELGEQINPDLVAKLSHQLETRQASLQMALDKEEAARNATPSKRQQKRLESATAKVEKAKGKVADIQAKLQEARHDEKLAGLKKDLAAAIAEQGQIRAAIEAAAVIAPADGVFLPAAERPDARVAAGQDFGRIVAPHLLHLLAGPLPGMGTSAVPHATLSMPPGRTGVLRSLTWGTGANAGRLEANVEGANPDWVTGATLTVDLGRRPWLWTILRPASA